MAKCCAGSPGRFLGIIGQDPSVSKPNPLHTDIFRFFFIRLGHNILFTPLKESVAVIGEIFEHNRLRSLCSQIHPSHVDILRFSFIKLEYILYIPLH